jgi:hypothetical protein
MKEITIAFNEKGHREVKIEHDVTLLDIVLCRSPKIEIYSCPQYSIEWFNKNTGKRVSESKVLEIIELITEQEQNND